MVERIERVGIPSWYGYAKYTQEVKKAKKTGSGNKTLIEVPVEMPNDDKYKVDIIT